MMHRLDYNEKGVSLVIVFFVMIIIVAVVLSTASFLYGTIKLIRNMSNSVVSFYAADSGIEKVLYYDRKVLADDPQGRGVCLMCDSVNPSCPTDLFEGSLNCLCETSIVNDPIGHPNGCDPNTCDDCTVSFTTSFDNRKYTIKTTVYPDKDPYDMEISSAGYYDGIGRSINVFTGDPFNGGPVCGDSTCDSGEDCGSCPGDCGVCPGTICDDGNVVYPPDECLVCWDGSTVSAPENCPFEPVACDDGNVVTPPDECEICDVGGTAYPCTLCDDSLTAVTCESCWDGSTASTPENCPPEQ